MPIWSAPPETEETKKQRIKKESESNTNEDALEAVIDKSKLAASSSTDHRNLRRKSSNIRGDVEGLHIHDQNKESSGKLEQVIFLAALCQPHRLNSITYFSQPVTLLQMNSLLLLIAIFANSVSCVQAQ